MTALIVGLTLGFYVLGGALLAPLAWLISSHLNIFALLNTNDEVVRFDKATPWGRIYLSILWPVAVLGIITLGTLAILRLLGRLGMKLARQ